MMDIAVCSAEQTELDSICSMLKNIISNRQGVWANIRAYEQLDEISAAVETGSADMYILCIDSSGDEGFIRLTEKIRRNNPLLPIIFIADNETHAMTGFKLHASGYLLTPVHEDEFAYAFELAMLIHRAVPKKPLLVKNSGTVTSIDINDIIYVENNIRAMKYMMRNGSVVSGVRRNTSFEKSLEPLLSSGDFVQTHKSFVVNMKYISSLKNDSASMINGATVPISRKHISEVHEKFAQFTSKTG